jgi:hypothetical protein
VNFIQTFWSCNKRKLLGDGFGFFSPEYHWMSWTLSCLQLRKYYGSLTLYTDSAAAKILIDCLKLPYTELVCNLDKFTNIHPHLWALPKIYTYSLQETPFLHIDGDVFIWKAFEAELLNAKLICQNKETSPFFYTAVIENLKEFFSYLPQEIMKESVAEPHLYAYNAGLMGGSDINFFNQYCLEAFKFVNCNKDRFHKINVSAFNNIYEQLLFYCMAKQQGKIVTTFFQDPVENLNYTGFADFAEIPFNKKYVHLHSNYKRNRLVCRQLAGRLRNDFPEYYYRIISMFKKTNVKFDNFAYSNFSEKSETRLLRLFNKTKQNDKNESFILVKAEERFSSWRSEILDSFFSTAQNKSFPEELVACLKKDLIKLENTISSILKKTFSRIDLHAIYRRDVLSVSWHELIFGSPDIIGEKRIIWNRECKMSSTRFDWSYLDESSLPVEWKLRNVINSAGGNNQAVIIPECVGEGYSLFYADELDVLIFSLLKKPRSVRDLFDHIVAAFDPDELKDGVTELQLLIYGRIKTGLVHKTISSCGCMNTITP